MRSAVSHEQRIEAQWLDGFCELVRRCSVQAGDRCALLSETPFRPLMLILSELALTRRDTRWLPEVLPTPRQTAPVLLRSIGASDAIGRLPAAADGAPDRFQHRAAGHSGPPLMSPETRDVCPA